jgi:hypothetical protein
MLFYFILSLRVAIGPVAADDVVVDVLLITGVASNTVDEMLST